MKIFVTFVICLAFACADQYTDRYDDIDVEEILSNKRLLATYLKCVTEKGPCTPEGVTLKDHLKDALQTGCEKCTVAQKEKAKIVLQYLHDNEVERFDEIIKKYDPEDQYREVYESFLIKSE